MYRFWVCQEMQFPDEITQKKKVRRASSLNIALRYVPYVALSKSGYGSKRNYASSQPVFTSSPYVIFGMPIE